ncbi:MAG TPA: hypothetical protein DCY75_10710 [Clostridiales bacterium]|nr:hypothetical protein [Clostridiales bacterium]
MGDALTAKRTIRPGDFYTVFYRNVGSAAAAIQLPYAQSLYFFAAAHAAHTLDALIIIPN